MTFGKKLTEWRERRIAEKEANVRALCQPSRSLHRGSYEGATSGQAVEKAEPVRCAAYRRLVSTFPCAFCGIVGYSQAAHPNTGKGMGMKTSDALCFPMCGPRPGVVGCHARFDQGALLTKEQRRTFEQDAARETREAIKAAGMLPKELENKT